MPIRPLNSSILRWPDRKQVLRAVEIWAKDAQRDQNTVGVGYFGSYAEGKEGVGSDIDLVIVLKESTIPFQRRGSLYNTLNLPVPADLIVYTESEFSSILSGDTRFGEILRNTAVWLMKPPNLMQTSSLPSENPPSSS